MIAPHKAHYYLNYNSFKKEEANEMVWETKKERNTTWQHYRGKLAISSFIYDDDKHIW